MLHGHTYRGLLPGLGLGKSTAIVGSHPMVPGRQVSGPPPSSWTGLRVPVNVTKTKPAPQKWGRRAKIAILKPLVNGLGRGPSGPGRKPRFLNAAFELGQLLRQEGQDEEAYRYTYKAWEGGHSLDEESVEALAQWISRQVPAVSLKQAEIDLLLQYAGQAPPSTDNAPIYSYLEEVATIPETPPFPDLEPKLELNRAIIVRRPELPWAHYHLGVGLREQGHLVDAEREFEQACAQDGGHSRALYQLGTLALMRDDRTQALGRFRQAAAIDPGMATTQLHIAQLLLDELENGVAS